MKKYSNVSIVKMDCFKYPHVNTFYRPSIAYPEYLFSDIAEEENEVYGAVRESFRLLGFDEENFGKKEWNPLGGIIKPGMTVLIKPNLVLDINPIGGTDCLFTHPSVVAPIIDYVLIALKGTGKIMIGDAPVQECNFDNLVKTSGYSSLLTYYESKGIFINLIDFRGVKSSIKDGKLHQEINNQAEGITVDLNTDSEFASLDGAHLDRMRITNYDPAILKKHHNCDKHEYIIAKEILEADVIINMPKPKSHRIAGVTIALKNFVGANVRKECLPHHTLGGPENDGDESNKNGILWEIRAFFIDIKNQENRKGSFFIASILNFLVRVCSFFLRRSSMYREGC